MRKGRAQFVPQGLQKVEDLLLSRGRQPLYELRPPPVPVSSVRVMQTLMFINWHTYLYSDTQESVRGVESGCCSSRNADNIDPNRF